MDSNEHMKKGAYWYYLCIKWHYTHDSCPLYLTPSGFETLKANGAALLDNFRLHTDSMINVLTQLPAGSLTIAVWMDHCDWFTPSVSKGSVSGTSTPNGTTNGKPKANGVGGGVAANLDPTLLGEGDKPCELRQAIRALKRALRPKGRVFWRSAAMQPWYARLFEEEGFEVERISVREVGTKKPIDGVNMYASSWKATWPGF
jgi:betaine lipid synthase